MSKQVFFIASHTDEDIQTAINVITEVGTELGIRYFS